MSEVRPFQAIAGASVRIPNDVTASSIMILPKNSTSVVLTNGSTTATAYYRVTLYDNESSVPIASDPVDLPSATTDMPVLPSSQIRVYTAPVGQCKILRTIASAADSYTTVTPGDGI